MAADKLKATVLGDYGGNNLHLHHREVMTNAHAWRAAEGKYAYRGLF